MKAVLRCDRPPGPYSGSRGPRTWWSYKSGSSRGFSDYKALSPVFCRPANGALANINFNEGVYDVNFARTAYDKDLISLIFEVGSHPEVWGQGNSEPLIYISELYIDKSNIQIMGAKQDTVKIEKNGVAFMKFHALDMIDELNKCYEIKLNVVGKANLNNWMGNITPQIFIENYEVIDGLLEF